MCIGVQNSLEFISINCRELTLNEMYALAYRLNVYKFFKEQSSKDGNLFLKIKYLVVIYA